MITPFVFHQLFLLIFSLAGFGSFALASVKVSPSVSVFRLGLVAGTPGPPSGMFLGRGGGSLLHVGQQSLELFDCLAIRSLGLLCHAGSHGRQ
jgi:hypothetical protein